MKSFWIRVIIFITILFIILFCFNEKLKTIIYKEDYYKIQYDEIKYPKTNTNSIIIGTSKSLHGIQPSIINNNNLHFYNFSLNGSTANFYFNWYQNIFKPHYKKPRVILIGVDLIFLDSAQYWRQYEQDALYFPKTVFLNNFFLSKDLNKIMLVKNRFPALKYLNNPGILFKKEESSFSFSDYELGFIPFESKNKIVNVDPVNSVIAESYKSKFDSLINLLVSDSIKIIFIQTPQYGQLRTYYEKLPINKYYDSLATLYHIPFLDYNRSNFSDINTKAEYFSDKVHLNKNGSTIFSLKLAKDLVPYFSDIIIK